MQTSVDKRKELGGFTLIELSIVLVIIGLIVGGILTGQDLIKAAEQRATLAQIEKYNTATNTFRSKFGNIPGDIPWGSANSFSLGPGGSNALTIGGNGNGILSDNQGTNGNAPFGEMLLFWSELAQANLIDSNVGNTTTATSLAGVGGGVTANSFPLAKLGRGNYIIVGSSNIEGFNYFGILGLQSAYVPGTGTGAQATYYSGSAAPTNNLNPLEAYNMDKKVDDGLPNTGTVQARTGTTYAAAPQTQAMDIIQSLSTSGYTGTATWNTTPGAAGCTTGSGGIGNAADTYNFSGSAATSPNCSMRFRFN